MKTYNAIRSKWMRRASALAAVLMLTMSFSGYASARILFQDDSTHDINSEGITLNADDGGDEDVTLQFGNDTTDATITFDDGTGDLTLATPSGGDFIIGSGTGLDFSGSDMFRIRENADPASNSACDFKGELIYDTTNDELQICTVTGVAGAATWTAVDTTGGSIDLQGAYNNDGAGAHEIILLAGGAEALEIRAQANNDDLLQLQNAAASPLINFQDLGGTTIDIDSLIVDWDATGAFSLDSTAGVHIGGANPSDFTVASDGAADDLTIAVTGATDSSVVISSSGTGTDAVDINATAGGITIDTVSAFSLDGAAAASNISLAADGAADDLTVEVTGAQDSSLILQSAGTSTTDAIIVNASAGGIDINADDNVTIDAANAGVSIDGAGASNFTTSSGALTLDGAGGVNIAGNAAEVDVTTTGALDLNSGAFTLDGSTVSIDGTDDSNLTITANDGADKTLTISATNAGVGDGVVSISANDVSVSTDTWDISSAGAASGFTTISGSGDITTSGGDFIIGTTGLTETTAANDSGAFLVGTFDGFDNSNSANVQDVLDDFDALIGTNAPNVDTMVFEPEYPNYTLWGDGTNNNGKMEALYDSANREQHYRWTTGKSALHDYEIRFRYTLPDDFSAVGDLVTKIRTATTNPVITDNAVDITLRNDTDNTQCATSTTNASGVANTWRDITITAATIGTCGGQTLAAGDVIEIILKLYTNEANSGITDVGTISLAYTN